MNLYGFTYNNPLTYVDRNGLDNWPVRPDDRDRPQRRPESRTGRRVERRTPPDSRFGDPNCKSCGPEVSAGLVATLAAVQTRFDALTDEQKEQQCSLSHLFGTWDIDFPAPPKGCGEGACTDTVMVNGKCYDKWKVNYILFGRISSLCDFWRIKMEGLVVGQKLIRKPLIDGDWENEYTGDVRGFMRIGYDWSGQLPSTLPGPTGGFSSCGPCKAAGANSAAYSSAFDTTWPKAQSGRR